MKKGFLKKRRKLNEDMSLQITSMADIFTILLVFLLKGYSTGAVNITPTKGLMLPSSVDAVAAVEALKIEISENAVQVEGQPVSTLKAFEFDAADLVVNGNSSTSKSLGAVLERERKRQLLIAQNNPDVKIDAKVMLIADQRVPYETIKSVLASAALQGYTDFKLATIKPE